MSSDKIRKLVMMANQIATAFEGQRGDAVSDTLAHLRAFWSPPMREALFRHLAVGGDGLSPTARAAVAELAAARPPIASGA